MIIDKEEFFQDKITTAYSDRLFKDFEEHGPQAIETFRDEDPVMYLRIACQLIPEVVLDTMRKLDKLDSLKKGGAKDGNSDER